MEAARVAAMRGHQVTLYEKGDRLGGQLLAACKPPRKEKIGAFLDYLAYQVEKLGVKVELGTEATPQLIEDISPEAVIIAAGTVPIIPEITGLSRLNTVTAEQVLMEKVEVGERVIIIGGGMVGCETAEFLADRGKKVTVVEILKRTASGMMPFKRFHLMNALRAKGVTILTEVKCEEMTEKGIEVSKDGEVRLLEADSIVIAAGTMPNSEAFKPLEGKVPGIYRVGDCVEPRRILEAIDEGYRAGCKV